MHTPTSRLELRAFAQGLGRTHENRAFERPPWLGDEVTGDSRDCNANLVHLPSCER